MKILIAADHAGYFFKEELKEKLSDHLEDLQWVDKGPENASRVDYPDFAEKVCNGILNAEAPIGILLCSTGVGMSIAANKVPGIRSCVLENLQSARLCKEHNQVQVLCFPSKLIAVDYAAQMVLTYLEAKPDTDERHLERLKKIARIESRHKKD